MHENSITQTKKGYFPIVTILIAITTIVIHFNSPEVVCENLWIPFAWDTGTQYIS